MSSRDADEGHLRARPAISAGGLRQVAARMRDSALVGVLPTAWAAFFLAYLFVAFDVFGFDFRGTVWEPARALVEGQSPYPSPTREAVEIGNPSVYPPFVFVLATPLGLLPFAVASAIWTVVLIGAVVGALRVLDVRDWRCYALALTSIPVVEGVFWGNVVLLLLLPLALAWRYRDSAWVVGVAVGVSVAVKLFTWPLIAWLLLTHRYRAAIWAASSAVLLTVGSWALIGFDGFLDYPRLLQALEDVYAARSFSVSTIAAGFGASVDAGVAIALGVGIILLGCAAWLARGPSGDVRSFSIAAVTCLVASPVLWPYSYSLLVVPIAVAWPRLAPAWLIGQLMIPVSFLPAYSVPDSEPCCRPEDVPRLVWAVSHDVPEPWRAVGFMSVAAVAAALLLRAREGGGTPNVGS